MKTPTHKTANKVMLGMSLVLFISSGLILGVKALTIGTANINTQQIIERITVANDNSLDLADIMVDLNIDGDGLSYIRSKLGIGTRDPQAALQVSGTIIANQFCDTNGTTCSTVSNMIGGGSGGTGGIAEETDPTVPDATTCISGQVIKYNGTSRDCGPDNVSDGAGGGDESSTNEIQDLSLTNNTLGLTSDATTVDLSKYLDNTHLSEAEVDGFVANNGYITGYTDTHLSEIKVDEYVANNGYITGYTDTHLSEIKVDEYVANNGYITGYTNTHLWSSREENEIYYLPTQYQPVAVGIGTGTPKAELHVIGNVLADAFLYPSDITLKTNITPIDNALDKIRQINAYTFDRKSNGKASIGFIAQELEEIYPILVHTNDDGIKSVNYVNMTVPLVQAVKELDAENQKLKVEIAEIKALLLK